MIKPIETIYKGYRFRSRLEARWAVFFDVLGIGWRYEMEGYEFDDGRKYLPDFYLPKDNLFVEVKGDHGIDRDRENTEMLSDFSRDFPILLVVGLPEESNSFLFAYDTTDSSGGLGLHEPYKILPSFQESRLLFWNRGDRKDRTIHNTSDYTDSFDVCVDDSVSPILLNAFNHASTKAKQARFEFGERG